MRLVPSPYGRTVLPGVTTPWRGGEMCKRSPRQWASLQVRVLPPPPSNNKPKKMKPIPNQEVIASLRERGFKVSVKHIGRVVPQITSTYCQRVPHGKLVTFPGVISPKGGATFVSVMTKDGEVTSASSYCSNKDNFRRRVGLSIALGRLTLALDQKLKPLVLPGPSA